MSQPDYAAVMVVSPVSGRWELMSSGGRIVTRPGIALGTGTIADTTVTAPECRRHTGAARSSSCGGRDQHAARESSR